MREREYPCEFCDTDQPQERRLVTLTMKRGGRWYIFENVPALVCPNCGHRYYDGPMLLELERMIFEEPEKAHAVEAWAFALPIAK
ncbi:MAG: type II toxin-antitoxin system MqsA family antitoxin [Anaerolineae bacterium]|nr:type II toxin-antitoxin system MqsA family antitoxin [Anaerolineae bacterium]